MSELPPSSETERLYPRFQALAQAAIRVQEALTPDRVLVEVGAQLTALGLAWQVAFLDSTGDTLEIRHLGVAPGILAAAERLLRIRAAGFRLSVDRIAALRTVVREQRAVFTEGTEALADVFPHLPAPLIRRVVKLVRAQGIISAPLLARGQVFGALTVWSSDLAAGDLPAVVTFAQQIATAYDNARLYQGVQAAERSARHAEETIRTQNADLESRVAARTAELEASVVALHQEIAKRAELEEALRRQNEEMYDQYARVQEATRVKSEFLANMSHELRTPLNAIIGFSELIHDGKVGPISEVQREYLGDVLTSSRHLLRMIDDVLDLTRVEAGRIGFRPEPVDLARLIGEVRDTLRPLAATKRIQLVSTVDPSLGTVVVDPARLKQVLYNYLSNALKFTPEEGRVAVRAGPEGEDAFRIEVEDTGIGIREEDLGRLFVAFQQLDAGMAKSHQGTGLGLALTKRIVEAQGGSVGVRSVVGEGSTFCAVLPRVARSTA